MKLAIEDGDQLKSIPVCWLKDLQKTQISWWARGELGLKVKSLAGRTASWTLGSLQLPHP